MVFLKGTIYQGTNFYCQYVYETRKNFKKTSPLCGSFYKDEVLNNYDFTIFGSLSVIAYQTRKNVKKPTFVMYLPMCYVIHL